MSNDTPCLPHPTQITPENFRLFYSLVQNMRFYQKDYFSRRDSVALSLAKRYEREVDKMLLELNEPPKPKQEELF